MKKILVVLLVLAVATGVFAQEGEWSFSGGAEIGAQVNFDPKPDTDGVKATSDYSHYNRLYDGYDGIKGKLGINYNRDVFGAGLTVQSVTYGAYPMLVGNLNADGENYQLGVESDLTAIIDNNPGFRQLWGNYQFLNGVFFLETAYQRGWAGDTLWVSDTVGAFRNWNGRANGNQDPDYPSGKTGVIGGNPFRTGLHGQKSFTMRDGDWEGGPNSYIVGDVRLQGLSFGLMMRDVFLGSQKYIVEDPDAKGFTKVYGNTDSFLDDALANNGIFSRDDWDELQKKANAGDFVSQATVSLVNMLLDEQSITVPRLFVDDVLKKMIFGVKFEMSPIEVAAQFLMEDYGVYIGGKWMLGPVTVGLSFMGILSEKELDEINPVTYEKKYKATEQTHMKVGGGVDYEADSFGAAVKGFYAIEGNKDKADMYQTTEIGIEPGFYYNVIPSHLRFQLDTGFYFYSFTSEGEKNGQKVKDLKDPDGLSTVQFALQPQLFWNFLGTGAGGYGGTGIALRYRIVGGDAKKYNPIALNNRFDVNFKYSF